MRALIFRKILAKLEKHTPQRLIALEIQILLSLASRAFRRPGKWVLHRKAADALDAYARYTVDCMAAGPADRRRIFHLAYSLGRRVRLLTGFTDSRDLTRLVFYLYRNIGIDMSGRLPGEIRIASCFFSRYYHSEQCALMSLTDWGVIAGICGGGTLRFTGRIPQGCDHCTAFLKERRNADE